MQKKPDQHNEDLNLNQANRHGYQAGTLSKNAQNHQKRDIGVDVGVYYEASISK